MFDGISEELREQIWSYLDTGEIAHFSVTSTQNKQLTQAYVEHTQKTCKVTENPFFHFCTRTPIIGPAGFMHKCIAKCEKKKPGEFWLCSLDAVRYLPYDYWTLSNGSTVLYSDDLLDYPLYCEYHYRESLKEAENRSESAKAEWEEIVNANPVNRVKALAALNVIMTTALPSEADRVGYNEQLLGRLRAMY